MKAASTLTQVQFLALLCMAERPYHGYALGKEIARRSAGAIAPGPASVHRTIRQLLDGGLARESAERPDPAVDDPRRRYFEATPAGREALETEATRWAALSAQARRALDGVER